MSSQERKAADTHSETSSSAVGAAMNSKARAHAIACLPELVEAARNLVGGASQGVLALDIAKLRVILAHIDGDDHD